MLMLLLGPTASLVPSDDEVMDTQPVGLVGLLSEPVQEVVFAVDQVRVEDCGGMMLTGLAEKFMVGGGNPVTITTALPEAGPKGPVQVRV